MFTYTQRIAPTTILQANITNKYKSQLAGEIRAQDTEDGLKELTREELSQQCEEIITQMLGQRCPRGEWYKKDLCFKDGLAQELPVHDKTLWVTGRTRGNTAAEEKATAMYFKQRQERLKKQIDEEMRGIATKQAQLDGYNEAIGACEDAQEQSTEAGQDASSTSEASHATQHKTSSPTKRLADEELMSPTDRQKYQKTSSQES